MRVYTPRTSAGASEEEISEIESWLGTRLPSTYRDFLLKHGNDENGPLCGSEFLARQLRSNNEYLPELLAENNVVSKLPRNYLCFLMHQGYIAFWFDLDTKNQDPICWAFSEGTSTEPSNEGPFSEFISDLMRDWDGT